MYICSSVCKCFFIAGNEQELLCGAHKSAYTATRFLYGFLWWPSCSRLTITEPTLTHTNTATPSQRQTITLLLPPSSSWWHPHTHPYVRCTEQHAARSTVEKRGWQFVWQRRFGVVARDDKHWARMHASKTRTRDWMTQVSRSFSVRQCLCVCISAAMRPGNMKRMPVEEQVNGRFWGNGFCYIIIEILNISKRSFNYLKFDSGELLETTHLFLLSNINITFQQWFSWIHFIIPQFSHATGHSAQWWRTHVLQHTQTQDIGCSYTQTNARVCRCACVDTTVHYMCIMRSVCQRAPEYRFYLLARAIQTRTRRQTLCTQKTHKKTQCVHVCHSSDSAM